MNRLTGTQSWKLRSRVGRNTIFGGDGSVLLEQAMLYWDWCDRHPWQKVELVKYQGTYEEAEVPLGRPYSMDGLTIFLGVSAPYFRSAKKELRERVEAGKASEADEKLLEAMEIIEQTTRTQQIEGAIVGVFHAGVVSRLNLLAENVNTNTSETVLRVVVRDQKTADDLDALNDLL